ncbi:hypothetical protein [Proteiniclasticum sp. QWL-01]|uniref:hypothetical protein n=1 Tax=Proteiniclasticum sp. QWL-01 TaxID=3036945 RepID=UPI00240F385E|nr:hypothetical protein [Proteiniclasticum sp. QWL-01]WFF72548.1 hypothetical protein P6M73_14930 [Proteiniclasticum sp. QWL-01]
MDDVRKTNSTKENLLKIMLITITLAAVAGSRLGLLDLLVKRVLIVLSLGGMAALTTHQRIRTEGFSLSALVHLVVFLVLAVLLVL